MYQPPPEGPLPNSGQENPFSTQGPQGNYPPQGQQFPGGNYPSYPPQGPQYNTPGSTQGAYNAQTQQYLAQPASPPPGAPGTPKRGFSLGFLGIAVVLLFGILIGFISGFGIGHSSQGISKTATAVTVPTSTGNQTAATAIPTIQPTDTPIPVVLPTTTVVPTVQPTATHTSTATHWTTTHSFSGTSTSKTATFTVPNDWNLQWSCNPAAAPPFGTYTITVVVYNANNTRANASGFTQVCNPGNTSGNVEQIGGGTLYLDVISSYTWHVNVQEKR